jgi:hypothetical protein
MEMKMNTDKSKHSPLIDAPVNDADGVGEKPDEVKKAEAHLKQAEAELKTAESEEQAALKHIEEAVEELKEAEHDGHEVHFTVDGEDCKTRERELTPNQIIRDYGKKEPATNYLVKIQGVHKESYQGKGDEEIKIHEHEAFQIVSTGPTPVSDMTGPSAFAVGLRTLGYNPTTLEKAPDHVVFDYPIEVGRFKEQTVRLGFVVPQDFPNTPPSGPHVSPLILPIHPSNDVPHPAGGIHQNMSQNFTRHAGGQWEYWSRPCPNWGQSKKSVTSYMGHIWRLWETQ